MKKIILITISLYQNRDTDVLVAINEHGLYVIDPTNIVILLGLKHEELSWDYAKPSQGSRLKIIQI